MENYFLGS